MCCELVINSTNPGAWEDCPSGLQLKQPGCCGVPAQHHTRQACVYPYVQLASMPCYVLLSVIIHATWGNTVTSNQAVFTINHLHKYLRTTTKWTLSGYDVDRMLALTCREVAICLLPFAACFFLGTGIGVGVGHDENPWVDIVLFGLIAGQSTQPKMP